MPNKLFMARIKASEKVRSADCSLDDIKHAVSELKIGRCMDPNRTHLRGFQNCW